MMLGAGGKKDLSWACGTEKTLEGHVASFTLRKSPQLDQVTGGMGGFRKILEEKEFMDLIQGMLSVLRGFFSLKFFGLRRMFIAGKGELGVNCLEVMVTGVDLISGGGVNLP